MKISDLRIHSIAMADPPLRSSYGLHQPYALRNVVEVESEDGIIGIAETYGGERPREALENLRGKIVGAEKETPMQQRAPLHGPSTPHQTSKGHRRAKQTSAKRETEKLSSPTRALMIRAWLHIL